MKHASLILPSLAIAGILVACATSDTSVEAEDTPTEPAPLEETKLPPPSTAATPPPAAEKQCVATCSFDTDCQSSCPAVTNGIQCCDLNTKKCFATSQNACPKPQEDAGTEAPAY